VIHRQQVVHIHRQQVVQRGQSHHRQVLPAALKR